MCFSFTHALFGGRSAAKFLGEGLVFKQFFISKLITMCFIGVTGTGVLVSGLAYHLVNKSTGRPIYTSERKKEHEQNRAILLQEFHAQPLTFKTDDGLTLSGLLIVREGGTKNLLFCHGYRMCKERLLNLVRMFPKYNMLLFDHRAHGKSEGNRTTIGYDERKDVAAALKVFKEHEMLKHFPIVGLGISMGAVSLLGTACDCDDFAAIILDSPFAQLESQARKTFSYQYGLGFVPFALLGRKIFEFLMKFSLDEVDALLCAQRARLPIMLIHSTKDRVAPIIDADDIFSVIRSKKEFWKVEGSGHARIFYDFPEEYCKHVHQFFDSVIA